MRPTIMILGFLSLCLLFSTTLYAGGDNLEFKALLNGDNEAPPVGPVVTDTTGKFEIEFNEDFSEAEFRLKVRDGIRVTQAHIHCAPEGVNGPIVAFLAGFHSNGWDVDGRWIDDASITDANIIPPNVNSTCPDMIENLEDLKNAGLNENLYANVHTQANPGGEVRGQLMGEEDDDD